MEIKYIIDNIKLAKLDNSQWLYYATALVENLAVPREAIPRYRDSCDPCQWLYEHIDEITLQACPQITENIEVDMYYFNLLEQIEILRYHLHEKYLRIFRSCIPELNSALFAFLFDSGEELELGSINLNVELNGLKDIVDELDTKLSILEAGVSAISSECSA